MIKIGLDPDLYDRHQAGNAARQQTYRDKSKAAEKLAKAAADKPGAFVPETNILMRDGVVVPAESVESAESAESAAAPVLKANNAIDRLANSNRSSAPKTAKGTKPNLKVVSSNKPATESDDLLQFKYACKIRLNKLSEAELRVATHYVVREAWRKASSSDAESTAQKSALLH